MAITENDKIVAAILTAAKVRQTAMTSEETIVAAYENFVALLQARSEKLAEVKDADRVETFGKAFGT